MCSKSSNSVQSEDLECRLCAQFTKNTDLRPIFNPLDHEMLHRVEVVTSIRLKYIPHLPQQVCCQCSSDLTAAFEFQNRCLEAQKFFFSARYRKELQRRGKGQESSTDASDVIEDIVEQSAHEDDEDLDEHPLSDTFEDDDEQNDAEMAAEESISYTFEKVFTPNEQSDAEGEAGDRDCETTETEGTTVDEGIMDGPSASSEQELPPPAKKFRGGNSVNVCDQCGAIFTYRANLLQHVRRHTNDKRFACSYCPKRFHSRTESDTHERVHTGEKPFKCKYCERAFASRSSWYVHERLHNNDRPYLCRFCGEGFKSSKHVKRHEMQHTGEHPFECMLCKMSFRRRTFLTTHYRSKTHLRNEAHYEREAALQQEERDNEERERVGAAAD